MDKQQVSGCGGGGGGGDIHVWRDQRPPKRADRVQFYSVSVDVCMHTLTFSLATLPALTTFMPRNSPPSRAWPPDQHQIPP